MNAKQLEVAALKLCELRGCNPDTDRFGRGYSPKNIDVAKEEIRAAHQVKEALEYGLMLVGIEPCPSCNTSDRVEHSTLYAMNRAEPYHRMICMKCGHTGPNEDTEEHAVARWNHFSKYYFSTPRS